MNIELSDEARRVVLHALQVYLSDLREEIAKTEKQEWRQGLHQEEKVLADVIGRLS